MWVAEFPHVLDQGQLPLENILCRQRWLIASIGYAFNVNMVKKHLHDISALSIVAGNFLLLIVPAAIVLAFTDFFSTFEMNQTNINSLGYVTILAIVGTGLAKVLYNKMVHLATPIFASSVTYLIEAPAVTSRDPA